MNSPLRFLAILVAGAVLVLSNTILFTVPEQQQALVLQFGDPVSGAINEVGEDEAGLKMKLPWQNVVYFDRRNLEFDLPRPEEIIVANEERLLVDAFVRYRITDPLLYFQTMGAGANNPTFMRSNFNQRLENILGEAMRGQLGSKRIGRIINEDRASIMASIKADVTDEARKQGVTIIDVRIRQADFPAENAANVYQRMISDYRQQAEAIRADGERRSREIKAFAEKEVVRTRAEAEEKSQIIRGRADAVKNCIFANAYQGIAAEIEDVPALPAGEGGENNAPSAGGEALMTDEEIAATLGIRCRITGNANSGDPQRREFFAFYR
ncbi:MAG: protease modulator HflC, partial [Pseudomonadota bacterium]